MAIDPTVALPSQDKVNVVWLDVNTLMGASPRPDLVPDVQAINNSLYNLFRCPIGARGPIFQPEYGSAIFRLLHEPMDYITANKVKMYLFQAIQRWEPRIILDMANSRVDPDTARNAYNVRVSYTLVATKQVGIGNFLVNRI